MSDLEIEVIGAEQLGAFVRAVWSDQLPLATARAINETAKNFQVAQRAHQETIFTIRRKQFVQNAVKIKPFANKNRLEATVLIDPPGGKKRADILGKFEDETSKVPRGTRIAIPTSSVPRTGGGIIKAAWRPGNLNLRPYAKGKVFSRMGSMVLRGDRGTFAVLRPGGRGALFERDGDDVTALYTFAPRVRIRPNLRFVANAERTVQSQWEAIFAKAFTETIRTARGTRL